MLDPEINGAFVYELPFINTWEWQLFLKIFGERWGGRLKPYFETGASGVLNTGPAAQAYPSNRPKISGIDV